MLPINSLTQTHDRANQEGVKMSEVLQNSIQDTVGLGIEQKQSGKFDQNDQIKVNIKLPKKRSLPHDNVMTTKKRKKRNQLPEERVGVERVVHCRMVLRALFGKKYSSFAWPFYNPVDAERMGKFLTNDSISS